MKERIWWTFAAGLVAHAALMGIVQDYYGIERYVEVVKAAWISPSISIPMNVISLIVVVGSMTFWTLDKRTKP